MRFPIYQASTLIIHNLSQCRINENSVEYMILMHIIALGSNIEENILVARDNFIINIFSIYVHLPC